MSVDIEKYREKLLAKKREIEAHVRSQMEKTEDLSTEVQDAGDKAQSSYSKEFLYICTNSDKRVLDLIEEALGRLDTDEFGRCVYCGQRIGDPRMEAIPWARHCIQCQELQEKGLIT